MAYTRKINIYSDQRADLVVTYQLAYLTDQSVDLCDSCVRADLHGCGALGPVQHGAHRGRCEGTGHRGGTVRS